MKSFKELFIYQTLTKDHPLLSGEPLFSEASAKVRTFSEPRKSFQEKFSNLMHFPAIVDGCQGHIRHTHYYILYRRRGNGAGETGGGIWEGGRYRGGELLLSGKTIISHPEVYRTVVSINIETSFSDCQLSGLHTGVYESIQFMAVLFSLPPYVRRELSLQICVAV